MISYKSPGLSVVVPLLEQQCQWGHCLLTALWHAVCLATTQQPCCPSFFYAGARGHSSLWIFNCIWQTDAVCTNSAGHIYVSHWSKVVAWWTEVNKLSIKRWWHNHWQWGQRQPRTLDHMVAAHEVFYDKGFEKVHTSCVHQLVATLWIPISGAHSDCTS